MEKTMYDHLITIEEALNKINTTINQKQNLYCPGCVTLKDILDTLSGIMRQIDCAKQDQKLSEILTKLEHIESTVWLEREGK